MEGILRMQCFMLFLLGARGEADEDWIGVLGFYIWNYSAIAVLMSRRRFHIF